MAVFPSQLVMVGEELVTCKVRQMVSFQILFPKDFFLRDREALE